jgi:hypothetical protein
MTEQQRLEKLKAKIAARIEAEAEREGASIWKHRAFTPVRKGKKSGQHRYGAARRERAVGSP